MDHFYVMVDELVNASSELHGYVGKAYEIGDKILKIGKEIMETNSQYGPAGDLISRAGEETLKAARGMDSLSKGIGEIAECYTMTEQQVAK